MNVRQLGVLCIEECKTLKDLNHSFMKETYRQTYTICPDLHLRVPIFTLQTRKSTNFLSRIYSGCMTVWLDLHLKFVPPCAASSLWKVPISVMQFHQYFFAISWIQMWKNFMIECLSWPHPVWWLGLVFLLRQQL